MARSVGPPHIVNIADLRRRGPAAPAARRVRLHRRRRRSRSDAARELPRVRGRHVPAAIAPWRRRACDLATTVLGTALDAAVPARAGRQQPHVLPARRRSGGAAPPVRPAPRTSCRRCPARRLEDVKAAPADPCWYQLYLVGGRDVALGAIERARIAGCSALVVTIDTPVAGLRERDVRNGSKELRLRQSAGRCCRILPQFLARPRWLAAYLADGGLMKFPNVVLPERTDAVRGRRPPRSNSRWCAGTTSAGFVTPGRARSSSRACTRPRMRGGRSMKAPTRSSCRITAAGSSTAWRRRLRVLPEVVAAVERACRGAARRRHPARQRRREGALPRRAGGARRPRLRVRTRRGRRPRRHARDRDPAHRSRPDAAAARGRVNRCARRVVRQRAGRLATAVSSESESLTQRIFVIHDERVFSRDPGFAG